LDEIQPDQIRRQSMKNKMLIVVAGLLLALVVVGVVGATGAFAQGPTTTPITPLTGAGRGPGDGHGFGLGQPEIDAAAKVLGMTSDELSTALQGGKTLEQIASEKNVDIAKVQEAIQAAHAAEMRDRIAQAVSDGTITQANADWLNEGLDKGYIGVPGAFGFGFGGGHHGGPGMKPGTNQNQNQTLPSLPQPTQPTQQSTPQG
jgi:hypothetical protein